MTVDDGNVVKDPTTSSSTLSHDSYQSLLGAVNGIVWEANAITYDFTFVSNSVTRILGYTPEEWLSDSHFWANHIYHEDRDWATTFCHNETQLMRDHDFDYRMVKPDGSIVWIRDIVTVVNEGDRPRWLRGIMVDITEAKLLADLDNLEKNVLELNARKDTDIETVLNYYVLGIERLFPQMKCSVLRIADGKLYNWASPSLPEEYTMHLYDKHIGPLAGSCGAAAYLKELVIANDIEVDEKWAYCKEYALAHNFRACWSYPIVDSRGEVMATFGMYYFKVTQPETSQVGIIERAAAILKILLENRQYARMMQEASALISQGQELANFGSWQWDIEKNKVSWSQVLYGIYGLDHNSFKATFEGYAERLHPEDRERVLQVIHDALKTGKDAIFEERIIRPDKQVVYLRSWARVLPDETGKPARMIGACLDVTFAKTTRMKMDEIAWMQSHVIRAPLARLLGLVDVLQLELKPNEQHLDLLGKIITTARELDAVIRNISESTRS